MGEKVDRHQIGQLVEFTTLDPEIQHLIQCAVKAREQAYCCYSNFPVGAALLAEDGRVFQGCNVENVSFGLTTCAERTAMCTAVCAGYRRFLAVAVTAHMQSRFVPPCGQCRQILAEFGGDMDVYLCKPGFEVLKVSLSQLLPLSFTPEWVSFENHNSHPGELNHVGNNHTENNTINDAK